MMIFPVVESRLPVRLVGQDDRGIVGGGAAQSRRVLLTTRTLRWIVMASIVEADFAEQVAARARRARRGDGRFPSAPECSRMRSRRHQMEELKTKPIFSPRSRPDVFAQLGDVHAINENSPVLGASSPPPDRAAWTCRCPTARRPRESGPDATVRSSGCEDGERPLSARHGFRNPATAESRALPRDTFERLPTLASTMRAPAGWDACRRRVEAGMPATPFEVERQKRDGSYASQIAEDRLNSAV
jgi:hypothetical protein